MGRNLSDYYRLPQDSECSMRSATSGESGFFRFGSAASCYGQCATGVISNTAGHDIYDAAKDVRFEDSDVWLPMDPSQIIDNLRYERYTKLLVDRHNRIGNLTVIRKLYYLMRELLPASVRRRIQRIYFSNWRDLDFPKWPVDSTVDTLHEELLILCMRATGIQRMPFIWFWPDGAANCLVMTHDVETSAGRGLTPKLMDLDA